MNEQKTGVSLDFVPTKKFVLDSLKNCEKKMSNSVQIGELTFKVIDSGQANVSSADISRVVAALDAMSRMPQVKSDFSNLSLDSNWNRVVLVDVGKNNPDPATITIERRPDNNKVGRATIDLNLQTIDDLDHAIWGPVFAPPGPGLEAGVLGVSSDTDIVDALANEMGDLFARVNPINTEYFGKDPQGGETDVFSIKYQNKISEFYGHAPRLLQEANPWFTPPHVLRNPLFPSQAEHDAAVQAAIEAWNGLPYGTGFFSPVNEANGESVDNAGREFRTAELRDSQNNFIAESSENNRDPSVPERFTEAKEGFDDAETSASPLILDLGGNGQIDLVSVDQAKAYFDIDGDGLFAENTGWVDASSGDGFLVADWNTDGIINGVGELFGNAQDQGFIELATLDSNDDGQVDGNDVKFYELQIWVDSNGNGYSEANELFSLSHYKIASISLSNTRTADEVAGNLITNVGSFTFDDGSVGNISDVWFTYDNWNSVYNESYTFDLRTLFLPTIRGYGDIPDLHIAMSLDSGAGGLLEKVSDLALLDLRGWLTKGPDVLEDELTSLMYHWAGVQDNDPRARDFFGQNDMDARKVDYLEKMVGDTYFFVAGWFKGTFANGAAADDLERTFFEDQMAIASRLFLQSAGAELFDTASGADIAYDLNADVLRGVGTLKQSAIDELEAIASEGSVNTLEFWTNVVRMVTGVRGDFESITDDDKSKLGAAIQSSDADLDFITVNSFLYGYAPGETVPSTFGDDILNGTPGDDLINGKAGNDLIYGYRGDDWIRGSFDNDTMYGGLGDDILYDIYGSNKFYGGRGNDVLEGGSDKDIYYYNVGDGHDVITEGRQHTAPEDEIVFGAGILLSDLTFVRINDRDLGIGLSVSAGGGSITLDNHFDHSGNYQVDLLRFADGTTFRPSSLNYTLVGLDDAEDLRGVLNGGGINDTIFGNGGNDRIFGNLGADNLYGGDGDDSIYANGQGGTNTNWDTATHILSGGAGWDAIDGAGGVDHITGGTGNDALTGHGGSDHYYFDYGDGDDRIEEKGTSNQIDTLHFGAGITGEMLSYHIETYGHDLTIFVDGGTGGSVLIINQFEGDSAVDTIEQAILDDGTVIDLIRQDYEWFGTAGDDRMHGRRKTSGGDDIIHGLAGSDHIYGENGNDKLIGGFGDDDLRGDYGDDTLIGGPGDDELRGGNDVDHLIGGSGNDRIQAGSGDDILIGGLGDDYLDGDQGTDTADYSSSRTAIQLDRNALSRAKVTGEGTDTLQDIDRVIGSEFNDVFFGTEKFDSRYGDFFDGGGGVDTLDYSAGDYSNRNKVVDLTLGRTTTNGINDAFINFENVITDLGADTLIGNDQNNVLRSGAGKDDLDGKAGNDRLIGGGDNDTINGGTGIDTSVYAGAFVDFFVTDHFSHIEVEDSVGSEGIDTVSNVEFLEFTDGIYDVARGVFAPSGSGSGAPAGTQYLYEGGVTVSTIADANGVNLGNSLGKTQGLAFETGSDVNGLQMLYEQGGITRGLNLFIENGKLFGAVWNYLEENWGYKELSANITANTKYTATLVMEGVVPANGTADLYLNGALVDTVSGVGQLYSHGGDIGIGVVDDNSIVEGAIVSASSAFKGKIETITHYNKALQDSELIELNEYLAEGHLPAGSTEQVIMEFGSVSAGDGGAIVSLEHSFIDPVVFMTMTSFNGAQVTVPRITNIETDSFTFYAQEADYLDGNHVLETFSYVVVEQGSWELSDGTKLEAGTLNTNQLSSKGFESISFASEFDAAPAVFSQVQTNGGTSFVDTRQKDSSTSGFDVALQEEEANNSGFHLQESVGWFAIEEGIGSDDDHSFVAKNTGNRVTDKWTDIFFNKHLDKAPQLLAQISSHDGADSSFARVEDLKQNSARIKIQEDQSLDPEILHTTETIDLFAIDGSGQLTGIDWV